MTFMKVLKITALIIVFLIILFVGGLALFLNFTPSFGGEQSDSKIHVFEKSGHYKDGVFINQIPTSLNMSFSKMTSILKDYIGGIPNKSPKNPLPVRHIDSLTIASGNDSLLRITWFGHSAFLLEINGKNILLDPMLGDVPAPHPWLGPKRFSDGLPIEIENLPEIDMVVLSHDHYDHLDYGSIIKLKEKVKHFIVPLGIGSHLTTWGVDSLRINELNWWDEINIEGLKFSCTPARHFSGRGIFDRMKTLWASWVIQSETRTIYFSGDSGYGPHFKKIGEKYGPFDFALMECGQYDTRWDNIHMLPEQTVQATLDLKARLMMPIHWGSFVLALHSWNDPVKRITKAARKNNIPIIVPQIGEMINLDSPEIIDENWWVNLE